MLPKNRISDQKSVGLGLRIVVWLWAPKPGYRGGLGTKLLSRLHTGLDSLTWSLTDCYKNDHKAEVMGEDAYPSHSSDEADTKIRIHGIQLCAAFKSTLFVYIVLFQQQKLAKIKPVHHPERFIQKNEKEKGG